MDFFFFSLDTQKQFGAKRMLKRRLYRKRAVFISTPFCNRLDLRRCLRQHLIQPQERSIYGHCVAEVALQSVYIDKKKRINETRSVREARILARIPRGICLVSMELCPKEEGKGVPSKKTTTTTTTTKKKKKKVTVSNLSDQLANSSEASKCINTWPYLSNYWQCAL